MGDEDSVEIERALNQTEELETRSNRQRRGVGRETRSSLNRMTAIVLEALHSDSFNSSSFTLNLVMRIKLRELIQLV